MALSDSMQTAIQGKLAAGTALLVATSAEVFLSNIDPKNAKLNKAMEERGGVKPGKWMQAGIRGALCFVVDSRGDHHFRVFRMPDASELFTVTLANDLQYKQLNDGFHYFHSEECSIGFNFVDRMEARNFFMIVSSRLPVKLDLTNPKSKKTTKEKERRGSKRVGFMGKMMRRGSKIAKRMSKGRRRSTKSSDLLFSPDDLDTEWKQKLQSAGIKKKDLLDPKMQKLIHTIVFNKDENQDAPAKTNVIIAPTPKPLLPRAPDSQLQSPNRQNAPTPSFSAPNPGNPYSRAHFANSSPSPRKMPKIAPSSSNALRLSKSRRPSKTSGFTPVLLPTSQSQQDANFVPNLFASSKSVKTLQEVEQDLDDFLDDEKFSKANSSTVNHSHLQPDYGFSDNSPPPVPPRSAAHNEVLRLRRDSKEEFIPETFVAAESNVPTTAPGSLPQFSTLDPKTQSGIVRRLREEVLTLRQKSGPVDYDSDGWSKE